MRWILIFLVLLVGIPVGLGAALFAMLEHRPLERDQRNPTSADVARAKALIGRHDPRRIPPGERRVVEMTERDFNLAVNYALSLLADGAATVRLMPDTLDLTGSVTLPQNPVGRYLNVRATVETSPADGGSFPTLRQLRLGAIPVPGWLGDWILVRALAYFYGGSNRGSDAARIDPADIIEAVRIGPGRMSIAYRWPENALERLQSQLVGEAERERLEAYHRALVGVVGAAGSRMSMVDLLRPMFAVVRERARRGDPVAEDRSLLVVLTAYINGSGLHTLLPEARAWPRAKPVSVRLQQRVDFSRHFLTSAGLAALGGGALANAIGLFKEVDDSRGGSGFSFTDLVADRAGTRFGEVAVRSRASAERLIEAVAGMRSEASLMPLASDLPENMSDAEFQRRFGGLEGDAYARMSEKIDRRIASLELYR